MGSPAKNDCPVLPCPYFHAAGLSGTARVTGNTSGTLWWVECEGCCAQGPAADTKIEAIAAWDARINVDKRLMTQNARIGELSAQRATLCLAIRRSIRALRRPNINGGAAYIEETIELLGKAYEKAGTTAAERAENLADALTDPDRLGPTEEQSP